MQKENKIKVLNIKDKGEYNFLKSDSIIDEESLNNLSNSNYESNEENYNKKSSKIKSTNINFYSVSPNVLNVNPIYKEYNSFGDSPNQLEKQNLNNNQKKIQISKQFKYISISPSSNRKNSNIEYYNTKSKKGLIKNGLSTRRNKNDSISVFERLHKEKHKLPNPAITK